MNHLDEQFGCLWNFSEIDINKYLWVHGYSFTYTSNTKANIIVSTKAPWYFILKFIKDFTTEYKMRMRLNLFGVSRQVDTYLIDSMLPSSRTKANTRVEFMLSKDDDCKQIDNFF